RFVSRNLLHLTKTGRCVIKKTDYVLPDQYDVDEYIITRWDDLDSVLAFNSSSYTLNGEKRNYLFKDYKSKQNFLDYLALGKDFLQKFYTNTFDINDAELLVDAYFKEYNRQSKSNDYYSAQPNLFIPLFTVQSHLYVAKITES